MPHYVANKAAAAPSLTGDWDGAVWSAAGTLGVEHFHSRSGSHRPRTSAKMLWDDEGIYVIFEVEDRYVQCVRTQRNSDVCLDSCVEFFVEPVAGRGYVNFEINCGGTMLLNYNAQSAAVRFDPVTVDDGRMDTVRIYHSMPPVVDPPTADAVTWRIEFFAPYQLFEAYVGPVPRGVGTFWRGNFYKCGGDRAYDHWAMWREIPGALGFHRPEFFAPIEFGPAGGQG